MAEIIKQDVFSEKVLNAAGPVLVGSGRKTIAQINIEAAVLGEVSTEKSGQLTIYKINVDENPDIAREYRVMSIPTMILFKGGQAVTTVMGAMPKNDLWKKLESAL